MRPVYFRRRKEKIKLAIPRPRLRPLKNFPKYSGNSNIVLLLLSRPAIGPVAPSGPVPLDAPVLVHADAVRQQRPAVAHPLQHRHPWSRVLQAQVVPPIPVPVHLSHRQLLYSYHLRPPFGSFCLVLGTSLVVYSACPRCNNLGTV